MAEVVRFAYRGRNSAGRVVRGRIEAANDGQAAERLRTMGLSPLTIREAPAGTGLNREISFGSLGTRSVGSRDIAVMTRQMATMISAGLTLLRTLAILREQTENTTLALVLDRVRLDVESGLSLSDALASHPREFPPLMLSLIRAGETGGFLEDSLQAVAANYEADVKLTGTITSALTYPVIVLIMAILSVAGMLVFIVPIFETMFAQLGATLPLPTLVLVGISKSLVVIGPLVIVGAIILGLWWRRHRHEARVRRVIDPVKLRLPVFGPLLTKVAVARLTRNLAAMTGAGVPILVSLGVVGSTAGNWVVEQALLSVQESVRQGDSIAGPLAREKVFPSMVVQMIAVGEDSGALETMLHKISDFYDQEIESTTQQLTALIEPLMIAFIGIVIGGMIVALYLPIFDVFNHVT